MATELRETVEVECLPRAGIIHLAWQCGDDGDSRTELFANIKSLRQWWSEQPIEPTTYAAGVMELERAEARCVEYVEAIQGAGSFDRLDTVLLLVCIALALLAIVLLGCEVAR